MIMNKRLIKDIVIIDKNPLHEHGVYYFHDDTDMYKGYALIHGQKNTPYYGGFYFFTIKFPTDYPLSPPKVSFNTNNGTTRFHPNYYTNGNVCLSILNTWTGDKWTPCQSLRSVLLVLCSQFTNMPLYNEPGVSEKEEFLALDYNIIIEYENINFAICDIALDVINGEHKWVNSSFAKFRPLLIQLFLNTCDDLMLFQKSKQSELPFRKTFSGYNIVCDIDYQFLEKKYMTIYNYISSLKN